MNLDNKILIVILVFILAFIIYSAGNTI